MLPTVMVACSSQPKFAVAAAFGILKILFTTQVSNAKNLFGQLKIVPTNYLFIVITIDSETYKGRPQSVKLIFAWDPSELEEDLS